MKIDTISLDEGTLDNPRYCFRFFEGQWPRFLKDDGPVGAKPTLVMEIEISPDNLKHLFFLCLEAISRTHRPVAQETPDTWVGKEALNSQK